MAEKKCPVCGVVLKQVERIPKRDGYYFDCRMCKKYFVDGRALNKIESILKTEPENWIKFSRWIRRQQSQEGYPEIYYLTVDHICQNEKFINPQEQANNLILWLGDNLKFAGMTINVTPIPFKTIIGSVSDKGVQFILNSLMNDKIIESGEEKIFDVLGYHYVRLTLSGWQRYEELKHQSTDSYKVFMAMSFEDDLYCVYEAFKKAVDERTGFELVRVDEHPKPGLVDDNIVVELRRARFVIADITNQNRGAYWEAGFAEGLGKPVIYSCRKKDFEDAHFDTNHRFTIVWDNEKLDEAAQRLVNMIRANISGAKMEDEVGQSR